MNSEVLSAIITGLTTIFAAALGVFIGSDHSRSKFLREFHAAQLSKLYEPLTGIFLFSDGKLAPEQVDTITNLIRQHNALAAPRLVEEWNTYLKAENGSLDKFQKVLSANYNWVKKCLGYSFDADTINLKYIPERRHEKLWYILGILAAGLIFFLYIYLAQSVAKSMSNLLLSPLLLLSYLLVVFCGDRLLKEAGRL